MVLPILAALMLPQISVVEVEITARIGALDGPAPVVFGRIADLATDADDNVFVLEAQASEVRVFRASGEHVLSFGREGQGPGELDRPTSISWNQGEVFVQNAGGVGSRFAPSGEFIESSRYPFGSRGTSRVRSDLVVLRRAGSTSLRRSDPVELLLLFRSEAVDTLWSAPATDLLVRNESGAGAFRSPFCGLLHHAVTPDEAVIIADGQSGRVERLEFSQTGSPRRAAAKQVTMMGTSLSDADYELLLARIPERFSARREHLQTAAVRSSICGIEAAPDGRLWVRVRDRGNQEVWVAHDPQRLEPLIEIVIPEDVEVKAVGATHAFGLWQDELGVQYVIVLKVPE